MRGQPIENTIPYSVVWSMSMSRGRSRMGRNGISRESNPHQRFVMNRFAHNNYWSVLYVVYLEKWKAWKTFCWDKASLECYMGWRFVWFFPIYVVFLACLGYYVNSVHCVSEVSPGNIHMFLFSVWSTDYVILLFSLSFFTLGL